VEKSNVVLSGKHLKEIRKAISKKPYQKLWKKCKINLNY
jgi:hypothetical protein